MIREKPPYRRTALEGERDEGVESRPRKIETLPPLPPSLPVGDTTFTPQQFYATAPSSSSHPIMARYQDTTALSCCRRGYLVGADGCLATRAAVPSVPLQVRGRTRQCLDSRLADVRGDTDIDEVEYMMA